jgi:hypothetical protein
MSDLKRPHLLRCSDDNANTPEQLNPLRERCECRTKRTLSHLSEQISGCGPAFEGGLLRLADTAD